MTLGQRIAQKRKELGLSQEGLGEQLGVSRQAIYKWESDASLPEIEKLITLSRIFSVPVGWLLGVEEESSPAQAAPGELTEGQLAMVQEIVERYLAAQPGPEPPKGRRFVKFCAGLAAIALVACLFNLFSKLDQVTRDYNNLRWAVDNVSGNVDHQISSITSRVEDILKSQNALTAEWSTEIASTDLAANTVTFDVRVVPKTYVKGMTAIFQARSGEEVAELPVEPGADHAFSGRLTCPLTDDISLTVVLITGDKRETQWLEDYGYLYSGSFPDLTMDGSVWYDMVHRKDNLLPASDRPVRVQNSEAYNDVWSWESEPPAQVRIGLFQDRKLVMWYEKREVEININGVPTAETAWFRPREVELEPGSVYSEALLYTDAYGRQRVCYSEAIGYNTAEQRWETPRRYEHSCDPADWTF